MTITQWVWEHPLIDAVSRNYLEVSSMKYSVGIRPVRSSAVTYIGHENGLTFVVFPRGATYVYRDEDVDLYDDLMQVEESGESVGRWFEREKERYEHKRVGEAYPQALGNRGKIKVDVGGEITAESVFGTFMGMDADEISAELEDVDDLYFILPQDTSDEALKEIREVLYDGGTEPGRALRGQTPGRQALWIANIGDLVLNYRTVDKPTEDDEGVSVVEHIVEEEKVRKKKRKPFISDDPKIHNLEKRAVVENVKKDKRLHITLMTIARMIDSLAKEVEAEVSVNIPYDWHDVIGDVFDDYGIPMYRGKGTPPPRNVGVMIVTE